MTLFRDPPAFAFGLLPAERPIGVSFHIAANRVKVLVILDGKRLEAALIHMSALRAPPQNAPQVGPFNLPQGTRLTATGKPHWNESTSAGLLGFAIDCAGFVFLRRTAREGCRKHRSVYRYVLRTPEHVAQLAFQARFERSTTVRFDQEATA